MHAQTDAVDLAERRSQALTAIRRHLRLRDLERLSERRAGASQSVDTSFGHAHFEQADCSSDRDIRPLDLRCVGDGVDSAGRTFFLTGSALTSGTLAVMSAIVVSRLTNGRGHVVLARRRAATGGSDSRAMAHEVRAMGRAASGEGNRLNSKSRDSGA